MMQSEINIVIKDRPPSEYFTQLIEQCQGGDILYGAIVDGDQLKDNFTMHCIPDQMETKGIDEYADFLQERRKLIAAKIRDYYWKL